MISSMEVDKDAESPGDDLLRDAGVSIDSDVYQYCETMVRVATECEKMFVEMYRSCYPHLFASLVKLQLSFLVELPLEFMLANRDGNSDDEGPCTSSSCRQPSPIRRVFRIGTRNETDPILMQPLSPQLLQGFRSLFAYLRKEERLATPFIFRVPGSASRVAELRQTILRPDGPVDVDALLHGLETASYSPHDVASTLKQCMAALSTNFSLFAAQFRSLFAQVAGLATPRPDEAGVCHPLKAGDSQLFACKQLKALRLLLLLLPDVNRHLLLELLDLLKTVSRTEASCMSVKALGIIFGPVLFAPTDPVLDEVSANRHCLEHNAMVTFMIEQYPGLSEIPASIVGAISAILDAHNKVEDAPSTVAYAARRRPGEEVARAYTEYAISELYAHVAKWPDSTRKRRIVRKISKMNGGITPSIISEISCAARPSKDAQPKRSGSSRCRLRPRIEKRHKRSITDRAVKQHRDE